MVGPNRHLNGETNLGKGTAAAPRRLSAAEACGSVAAGKNLDFSDAIIVFLHVWRIFGRF